MIFRVSRTSEYNDEVPPCSRAVKGKAGEWDRRTFRSPEEYDAKLGMLRTWSSDGTDHQIVRDAQGAPTGIKRRVGEETAWFLDLGSLEDLLRFQAEHGDLIVQAVDDQREAVAHIEVYDDYRE